MPSDNGFSKAHSRSRDRPMDKPSKEELANADRRRVYIGNLGFNVSVYFDLVRVKQQNEFLSESVKSTCLVVTLSRCLLWNEWS